MSRNQFCQLSPKTRSAVATVWVRGADDLCKELFDQHFNSVSGKRAAEFRLNRVYFGKWNHEELVITRKANSTFEIHCHGGVAARQIIASDLLRRGFEELSWSEWEFLNCANAIEAECSLELQKATTERTATLLMHQRNGSLLKKVLEISGRIESQATDELALAQVELQELIDRCKLGLRLTTPFQIAICGKPNVGKSSLLNAIVGFDRAIVIDQPGTTRDVVSQETAIDGWPVVFADTAGVREATSDIEDEGIRRGIETSQKSDLNILVLDRSSDLEEIDKRLLHQTRDPLIVLNKSDLPSKIDSQSFASALGISTKTMIGMQELLTAISMRLAPKLPDETEAIPFTIRQQKLLVQCQTHLIQNDFERAILTTKELIGDKIETHS